MPLPGLPSRLTHVCVSTVLHMSVGNTSSLGTAKGRVGKTGEAS